MLKYSLCKEGVLVKTVKYMEGEEREDWRWTGSIKPTEECCVFV